MRIVVDRIWPMKQTVELSEAPPEPEPDLTKLTQEELDTLESLHDKDQVMTTQHYADPEVAGRYFDALRRAGLPERSQRSHGLETLVAKCNEQDLGPRLRASG